MGKQPLESRFNAYLDQEMTDAERAEFEALIASDEALRTRLDRWRQIEAGLSTFLGGADAPDPLAFAEAATSADPITLVDQGEARAPDQEDEAPWFRRPVFAAAAAVLIAAGGYFAYTNLGGSSVKTVQDSYLYAIVTQNFEPAVVCDTPEKFLDYTEESLGESVTADFAGASTLGVTLVGWDTFGGAYSEDEKNALPRVLMALGPGGEKIVVYFRGRGHDALEDDETNRTNVVSKKLGRVTAYELSPLDQPFILDLLGMDD